MTINDIFKSDFLEQVTSFSVTDMLISLSLAFAIGLFIYEIYKITYRGVMYSRSFGLTLLTLAMTTDLAIMTVTSNVVLSLGMVGALSIVRFRTAIKEPLDIAFLLWSIVVGIMLGTGMIPLAVFGSLILGLIFYLFTRQKKNIVPYILVLQCENEKTESEVLEKLNAYVKNHVIKSKTVGAAGIELTVEINLDGTEAAFLNDLQKVGGVSAATLVSYNGEYMS
ncbi:MAG TPA: DUF4956 domain-containing protein [Clostridiales bacterium]|nr:DUF4956 domain-containing protein [Clostridiales bacterium]